MAFSRNTLAFRPLIPSSKTDPHPINESIPRVNLAIFWNIYRRIRNGKKALYGGANHRAFASCRSLIGQGKLMGDVLRELGVTGNTYYRWRMCLEF